MPARVLPLGDAAFTLSLPEPPGPALSARLRAMGARLAAAPGVLDTVQSFQTLTVFHDPDADRAGLEALALAEAAAAPPAGAGGGAPVGALVTAPVSFAPADGPDQESAAAALGMTPAALAAALCAQDWPVLAVGFLPGFPFLGPLPPALKLPRRASPRLRVPAGSVAIANGFCGIYPWVSPGGWHILGRCDLRLFDPAADPPALLAPGDRVRLTPVGAPGGAWPQGAPGGAGRADAPGGAGRADAPGDAGRADAPGGKGRADAPDGKGRADAPGGKGRAAGVAP